MYITKPRFTGNVNVSDVSFHYIPNDVHAVKTNVQLDFTEKALIVRQITYKHKKNTIFIEGKIDNFLNLYYDAPEKMIVNWNVYCPNIDVKQLLAVLAVSQKRKNNSKKEEYYFEPAANRNR